MERPDPVSSELQRAIAAVPPGAWAVGVSGGADSVALLTLLCRLRPDLALEVVHLNHETRGAESDADAEFVDQLAARLELDCVSGRWSDTEPMLVNPPKNRSARFRAGRMALFRHVVQTDKLQGVILAHHADDVAETVFQRLLRGSGPSGLAGIADRSVVGGMLVLRPLVRVRRATLREWLATQGQAWREDASNESNQYLRNRLRKLLAPREDLTQALLRVADASAAWRDWLRRNTPAVAASVKVDVFRELPAPLAREAARRWLRAAGVPDVELTPRVIDRLLEMAVDAASPPRRHFPGRVLVCRRGGELKSQI
jgi:tRNA(Ile)-lysidine synthetase-like protein